MAKTLTEQVNRHLKSLGYLNPTVLDFNELKKRYRSLSKTYHPDSVTGDSEKFKEIQTAYEFILKWGSEGNTYLNPTPVKPKPQMSRLQNPYHNRGISPFGDNLWVMSLGFSLLDVRIDGVPVAHYYQSKS